MLILKISTYRNSLLGQCFTSYIFPISKNRDTYLYKVFQTKSMSLNTFGPSSITTTTTTTNTKYPRGKNTTRIMFKFIANQRTIFFITPSVLFRTKHHIFSSLSLPFLSFYYLLLSLVFLFLVILSCSGTNITKKWNRYLENDNNNAKNTAILAKKMDTNNTLLLQVPDTVVKSSCCSWLTVL